MLYENLPMQYTESFISLKKEKFIGKKLAVLTSTHNLCFGAKIRKICKPLYTPVCYIKVGFEGVYISRACFPDVKASGQSPKQVK